MRARVLIAAALVLLLMVTWIGPGVAGPPDAESAPPSRPTAAASGSPLGDLPLGKGLPLAVAVGVSFVDVPVVSEVDSTFDATVDLRVRWQDLRLAFPAVEAPSGFVELQGEAAAERLAQAWTPDLAIANLVGEAGFEAVGARFWPDGRVEVLRRTTGTFSATFPVEAFPFDRLRLPVEVVSRRDTADRVTLLATQADVDFSDPPATEPDGWRIGGVQVRRGSIPGWYGRSHGELSVGLVATRDAWQTVPAIFIPLLASLLIPFVSIWMNGVEDGEFAVDAFELANIIIGGLFALVALNFTVNSGFPALAAGGNPIARLFALNYMTLGAAMGINLTMFRYGLVARYAGKYAQEQLFRVLTWAVPALSLGTAAAIVAAAAA